ncbi:unnamed protein product, partial [Choristocarpus tenellus]
MLMPLVWPEKMLKDPHSPACKLLRDLGLTPNDAKELNLLEVLRGLPRKERSKYVKRNSLSVEERAELKKKRNREHARDTRKRKKVIMEALQAQVSGLRERLDVPWGAGGTMSVHQGRCTVVEQFFQLLTALASSQDAVAAATMGLRALTSSDFQFTWPALPQHETFIKVEGSQRGEAGGGEGEYANLASQACVAKGVDDVLVEVTGFPARLAGLLEKAKNIAQEDNRDIMVSFGAIVRGSLDFSSISGVGVEEGDVHRCADSCADSCAGGDQIVGKRRTFVGTESESGHWANTRTWERVGADDCERSKEDSGSLVDPPLQPILSSGNTLFCGCEIKCALGRARGEPLRLTRVGGMAKCVFTQAREGTRVDAEE